MSMSIEEKTQMGVQLLNAIDSFDVSPERLNDLLDFTIINLIVRGESPATVCDLLTLGVSEDIKKKIADGIVESIKNKEDDKITGMKEMYNRTVKMAIETAKHLNPSIVDNVVPFSVAIGQGFIEAGQRICNGEAGI